MNRLQAELHRLYGPLAGPPLAAGVNAAAGRVAVLELSGPADWPAIARVWRGVQADLGLPAPAIAVSGDAGYQLWFSFAHAQPMARLAAFLQALRLRYLGDLAAGRLLLLPDLQASPQPWPLPPRQLASERWSAFLAPDLAPVFAAEPWLDTEPGTDGQADLLMRLASIQEAELQTALERLGGGSVQVAAAAPMQQDPRRFLLGVMNDESVALALRIEAAKALMRSPHP